MSGASPLLTAALLAVATPALAHGPAPSVLEVLAWPDGADACDTTTTAGLPVVRSNLGLATPSDGHPYGYVCPSRWGGGELAPSAASADGRVLVVAREGSFARSSDGGCTWETFATDPEDVVVDVTRRGDTFLVATRRFDDGSGAVWAVQGSGVTEIARWPDHAPDGVLVDGDTVWLSGARPSPWATRLDGETLVDEVTLPLDPEDPLDRLTPRGVEGGPWLLAGQGERRTLWRVTDGVATAVLPAATVVHGPVRVGDAWWAALDGVAWTSADGDTWTDSGETVAWTCLGTTDGQPYACQLDTLWALSPGAAGDVPTAAAVFTLSQLDPPDLDACDVGDACELDWFHFAGESGWVGTGGAECPDGERPVLPGDTDGGGRGEACGCATAARPGGLGVLVVGVGVLVRRRRLPRSG